MKISAWEIWASFRVFSGQQVSAPNVRIIRGSLKSQRLVPCENLASGMRLRYFWASRPSYSAIAASTVDSLGRVGGGAV